MPHELLLFRDFRLRNVASEFIFYLNHFECYVG